MRRKFIDCGHSLIGYCVNGLLSDRDLTLAELATRWKLIQQSTASWPQRWRGEHGGPRFYDGRPATAQLGAVHQKEDVQRSADVVGHSFEQFLCPPQAEGLRQAIHVFEGVYLIPISVNIITQTEGPMATHTVQLRQLPSCGSRHCLQIITTTYASCFALLICSFLFLVPLDLPSVSFSSMLAVCSLPNSSAMLSALHLGNGREGFRGGCGGGETWSALMECALVTTWSVWRWTNSSSWLDVSSLWCEKTSADHLACSNTNTLTTCASS